MKPLSGSLVMLALAAITVALCLNSPATQVGDNAGVNLVLPERVLHLTGKPGEMSEAEKEWLPEDTGFAQMGYRGREGFDGPEDIVSTTIVLSANDRRSLHRPEVCLPGQNWTIDSTEVVPIEMASGEVLKVKKLGLSQIRELSKDETVKIRAIYTYWYVGKDVTTPSTLERVGITAMDNVFRNVNHRWAYVSVMSFVTDNLQRNGRDEAETLELIKKVVRESVPVFQKEF